LLDVDGSVSNALCSVDEYGNVVAMCCLDDALYVVDGAKGVVHVSHADKACARTDDALVVFEDKVTVFVHRDGSELCTSLLAHLLPRNDVGVVVEGGNDDLVTWVEVFIAECLCNEVDAFGGSSDEYNVFG